MQYQPDEFAGLVKQGVSVLDVRKISEAENGHIRNATVMPLQDLLGNLDSLDKNEKLYIHCAGGYRSVIAASLMKVRGFHNLVNVHGGWRQIMLKDVPVVTGTPSNLALS
jgi:rhodanese-related sulfurtransferase